MRAAVPWTINDFPVHANLSGWSTKGRFACPSCHYNIQSKYLKNCRKFCYMSHRRFLSVNHRWRKREYQHRFDSRIQHGRRPTVLNGMDVLNQQLSLPPIKFGKLFKRDIKNLKGWKKK